MPRDCAIIKRNKGDTAAKQFEKAQTNHRIITWNRQGQSFKQKPTTSTKERNVNQRHHVPRTRAATCSLFAQAALTIGSQEIPKTCALDDRLMRCQSNLMDPDGALPLYVRCFWMRPLPLPSLYDHCQAASSRSKAASFLKPTWPTRARLKGPPFGSSCHSQVV